MLLRMQSCMIIAFKKVFRCGCHGKPSLLVTQRGSSPGVKLTVKLPACTRVSNSYDQPQLPPTKMAPAENGES